MNEKIMRQEVKSETGKKKKGPLIAGIILAAIAIAGAGFAAYLHSDGYRYKASHFPKGTTINEVDCAGMTAEEAAGALTEAWQKETFVVREDGKKVASFSLKKTDYDVKEALSEKLGNSFFEVLKNSAGGGKAFTLSMTMEKDKDFDQKIKAADFLDIPYKTRTEDAYVNMENTDFAIVKEVYGDNVDKDGVVKAIRKSIAKGEFTLDFDPQNFIDQPEVKADDEELLAEQEFDKEHYSQKIVYETFNGSHQITPADLKKMRPVDEDGKATVDEKAIAAYMKDVLAWEVNTQYFERKFKSTDQGTITLAGGTLGYVLDKKKEAKQLAEDLQSGEDVSREPIFSQKPYFTGKGESDIGGDYIEVSIASQTLWLYKDGKNVMTTAVTTGKSGHGTSPGAYYIEYMQRNATLRGQDYESKVDYWMPFNGSQGCHDATWRSDFGSGAYTSNGSHGCVNMPYSAAAEMYGQVEKGFPVLIH